VTDGKLAENNSYISFYDGYVQPEADAGTETGSYGWTWKSIVSTSTVESQDHSGTAGNASTPGESTENYGLPIFKIRSHLVSENYWKFWKGELDDDIRYDASGDSGQRKVWTGSTNDKGDQMAKTLMPKRVRAKTTRCFSGNLDQRTAPLSRRERIAGRKATVRWIEQSGRGSMQSHQSFRG
jgi:hypothetical protein